MKHTPLYQEHMAMGGQMANYKGYALPNQYLGVEDEHRSVREKSGLFDRSYLTRVLILGPNAAVCVQRITTNVADQGMLECAIAALELVRDREIEAGLDTADSPADASGTGCSRR